MKKYLAVILLGFLSMQSMAQLTIQSGVQWITTGQVTVNLQDMNFVNNGTFLPGDGLLRFSGVQTNTISSSTSLQVQRLELQKSNNAQVNLQTNMQVSGLLIFSSGNLNLNGKTVTLNNGAALYNEKETSRIIGTTGGEVVYTTTLNAPQSANPGYLGAFITSTANLGTVTIRRGHLPQSGNGLTKSINRYYVITPQNNTSLNASMQFIYFDAEKNGLDENSFVLYQTNDGTSWTNLSQTSRSTTLNYVEKTGINSFSKYTLGTDVVVAPGCSATGVALNVKSAKQNTVSITWTTATETNNKGFAVDRKLKTETVFSQIGYAGSNAIGGNSSTALSYSFTDANPLADVAEYRLRIVSLTDNICFSDVKTYTPKGGGKGKPNNNTTIDTKQGVQLTAEPKLTVGPNPNRGNFYFSIEGIEEPTVVELFTIDGKAISKFIVTNLQKQQVNGLRAGVYLLRAPVSGLVQKIIVQ
ncbi:T9SS type A sorting domain-containing protein [Lacibacter luteus]|uniref:T9SS type A sorting domain-containing protein n=1 Tax=Lacibacter luteus TaxID=2508719 RepID=A0A4Q1CIS7_9BACT|nr:T9SS type A sorting domain-containing protein [Lacibacter luteus]RXK60526.1 T9SS type A sorting domain-containing protein [Lacibacter luteus]